MVTLSADDMSADDKSVEAGAADRRMHVGGLA
jgi:hypothetical protein